MTPMFPTSEAVWILLYAARLISADFSIDSYDEIKQTAAQLARDTLQYYHGNESGQTPGILPGPPPAGPYFWWEGGALWGTLVDYWHLTGDATYNELASQAMLFQAGANKDYQPKNITASLGNDDQAFWGMTVMMAAEEKFPDPTPDQPGWLALAQAVFNTQADPERHDSSCGGGLRWQIPVYNSGYDYKNSIANGCFFNIAARLARYTGNQTYAEWAVKTWDWMEEVGLMTEQGEVFDGALVEDNCTDIRKTEFSYNNAVFLQGAAFMYNHTADDIWKTRVTVLLDHGLSYFFPNGIMVEPACEFSDSCSTDMLSFKGYVHRWYSVVSQVAPFTAARILPVLQRSTAAAVKTCAGGDSGRACGFNWAQRKYTDLPGTGAGQQMNVLGAVSSLLIRQVAGPVTHGSGGTSAGDPNAGRDKSMDWGQKWRQITMADRAGAVMLTMLMAVIACGLFGWMSVGV